MQEDLGNSTYRVTVTDLVRAGTYSMSVKYDGMAIVVQPSANFEVVGACTTWGVDLSDGRICRPTTGL